MVKFVCGQRWVSKTESELGLGVVIQSDERKVVLHFPASEVVRAYAAAAAPLQRVRFQPGERIFDASGAGLIITKVTEKKGLITYHGERRSFSEKALSNRMAFSTPQIRFGAGQFDPPDLFDLRIRALKTQHRILKCPVRGFVGSRIELYPHQLFIAHDTAGRMMPRVLLSDETGLGKTIEACLILHRLILCGRVQRALILVPQTLVYQWFVELFVKFNLSFQIIDESYCQAVEKESFRDNPFLAEQLILCSVAFFALSDKRRTQALAVPWDLLIIDEAHHIKENSAAYTLVSELAPKSPGLLLLTATPEQLGLRDHFARLRLLDPARYHDYDAYQKETAGYRTIAQVAQRLVDGKKLAGSHVKRLLSLMPDALHDIELGKSLTADSARDLLDRLIDRYGPGRVIRRNTRSTVKGFFRRSVHLIPLEVKDEHLSYLRALSDIFQAEHCGRADLPDPDFSHDTRIVWLADLLRSLKGEKVLLICSSIKKVKALRRALAHRINIDVALFHEELTLLQRDRNAAWFAQDNGASLLICSEIGSEGRNFQFAHHLVLFDLPLNPELLEQRIGRLDRIGQKRTVTIHVPFLKKSPQHVLGKWYHDGLDQFRSQLVGGLQILERFGHQVAALATDFHRAGKKGQDALAGLISETKAFRKKLSIQLSQGRNRLLEISSFRPKEADKVVRAIEAADGDSELEEFMTLIWDHFGVEHEPIGNTALVLRPGIRFDEHFPFPPEGRMAVTFDRNTAVCREDLAFITWDHPMVTEAIALILGSSAGNCCACVNPRATAKGAVMEAVFVLECVAPAALYADRFLPPTPIHVAVNQRLETVDPAKLEKLIPSSKHILKQYRTLLETAAKDMLSACRSTAEKYKALIIEAATTNMEDMLGAELKRLIDLKKVNPDIRPEEIDALEEERRKLSEHFSQARIRLDALRFIMSSE